MTRKLIIAGTFNRITAPRFPTVHQPAWVYVAMRDLVQETDLSLVYKDEADDSPFWRIEMEGVSAPDRLTTREIGVQILPIALPEPGKYCIDLLADDHWMGSLKIEAIQGEEQPEKGGEK